MKNKKGLKEYICSNNGFIVFTIILYIIIFGLMATIGSIVDLNSSDSSPIFSIIVFLLWAIPGWKFLSKIQPSIFLIMPIVGWIIYFVVKGMLALVVGVFVSPYYISRTIRNFINLGRLLSFSKN